MGRIDSDHAGHAIHMPQGHVPDYKATPVMADENGLIDLQMIEQPHEIAGKMLDVVRLHSFRPIGRTIAALVRGNHSNSCGAERLDLVAPGKRNLRPAVAKNEGRLIRPRACFVVAHSDSVGLGEFQLRHL